MVTNLRALFIPALGAAMMAQGCSPFVTPDAPRPGFAPSPELSRELDAQRFEYVPGTTSIRTTYVSLGAARAYAQFVQDSYQSALERQSRVRMAVNVAALGTALASVGIALTAGVDADALIYTTLATAGLGIGGQFLITRAHETAYALGAKAVGCVVTAATDLRPASLPLLQVQVAQAQLRSAAQAHAAAVDAAQTAAAALNAPPPPAHSALLAREQTRQQTATFLLAFGDAYLSTADVLGEQLVNRVEEIRLAVNDAVRRAEPDVITLDRGLRDIIGQRVGSFGVPGLTSAQQLLQTPAPALQFSTETLRGFPTLERAWITVEVAANTLNSAEVQLRAAITAAGDTVVRFPQNAFAGCSIAGLDAVAGPEPVAVMPASVQIAARTPATARAAVSGRGPFAARNDLAGGTPTVEGALLSVPVTAAEATAGRRIQTVVSDLSGNVALFEVIVASGPSGGGGGGGGGNAETALLRSDAIKEIQEKLEIEPQDQRDGRFGRLTRAAILRQIGEEQSDLTLATLRDPDTDGEPCTSATVAFALLLGGAPADAAALTAALNALYSDAQRDAVTRQPQDEPLLKFYQSCDYA